MVKLLFITIVTFTLNCSLLGQENKILMYCNYDLGETIFPKIIDSLNIRSFAAKDIAKIPIANNKKFIALRKDNCLYKFINDQFIANEMCSRYNSIDSSANINCFTHNDIRKKSRSIDHIYLVGKLTISSRFNSYIFQIEETTFESTIIRHIIINEINHNTTSIIQVGLYLFNDNVTEFTTKRLGLNLYSIRLLSNKNISSRFKFTDDGKVAPIQRR